MPNYTATVSASILVQDTSGTTPVTSAQDSKTDQMANLEEQISATVVVPANTDVAVAPVVISFAPFAVTSVLVKSDRPVTMQVGTAGVDTSAIRSAFVETYISGEGPNALEFGNTDLVNAATVTVVAAGEHP